MRLADGWNGGVASKSSLLSELNRHAFFTSVHIKNAWYLPAIKTSVIWSCRDPAIVLQARADFAKWYEADLQRGSCVVVRYPDRDKELVLVPVTIKTGAVTHLISLQLRVQVPALLIVALFNCDI